MTKLLVPLLFVLAVQRAEESKIRVLIVDGINNHDWRTATDGVRQFLSATGRFTVDVSTTPPADASQSAWD
jgi:hypothetical protein